MFVEYVQKNVRSCDVTCHCTTQLDYTKQLLAFGAASFCTTHIKMKSLLSTTPHHILLCDTFFQRFFFNFKAFLEEDILRYSIYPINSLVSPGPRISLEGVEGGG